MDQVTKSGIDDWLSSQGENPSGKPLFRLVWSDDQREMRRGVFNIFHETIFLRTEIGIRSVPKYNYIRERWVLEKWSPDSDLDLPESYKGTYEPFFVFEDGKGNYLPPTLKVVQFIVNHSRQPVTHFSRVSELKSEDTLREDKEVLDFVDELDTSPMQSLLHTREAVGYTKGIKDA